MQSWSLSLAERVELLQSWILPLLVYPSRVVYPTDNVIAAVKTIYRVALKLSNWGITLDILSHSKEQGGLELAPPTLSCFGNFPLSLFVTSTRPRPFLNVSLSLMSVLPLSMA